MRWLLEKLDVTQIGSREWIAYYTSGEERTGIIELHELDDGTICGGSVRFAMPYGAPAVPRAEGVQPEWHVDSLDPLTLSPSVLCAPDRGGCGHHGFIRGGRWVGA